MKKYKVIFVEFEGKNDFEQEYILETDINPLSENEQDRWAFKDLFYNESEIRTKRAVMIKEILSL